MSCLIVLLVPSSLTTARPQAVLPTRNSSTNFCNFPHAWTVTQGEGIKVAVVGESPTKIGPRVQRLRRLAPKARIESLTKQAFLATPEPGTDQHVVLLLAAPLPAEYTDTRASIRRRTGGKAAVILPAYFGAMKSDVDYGPWHTFVRSASTWNRVVFAYVRYEGKRAEAVVPDTIEWASENSKDKKIFVVGTNFIDEMSFPNTWGVSQTAPLVAGVAATLKQLNPGLAPHEIKRMLEESCTPIDGKYPLLDALQAVTWAQSGGPLGHPKQ